MVSQCVTIGNCVIFLVVCDTEILKELSDCWIFFDKVVFPAPEGEDKTTIRGLLWLLIKNKKREL